MLFPRVIPIEPSMCSLILLWESPYYSNYAELELILLRPSRRLKYSTNSRSQRSMFILDNKGTNSISAGIQSGFGMRSIDLTNAVFAQGGEIDPWAVKRLIASDILCTMWVWVFYGVILLIRSSFYLGTAMHHLNQQSFRNLPRLVTDKVYAKFSVIGGMQVPAGERIHINQLYCAQTGSSTEINLSALMSYSFNREPFDQNSVAFGIMYRGPLGAVAVSKWA